MILHAYTVIPVTNTCKVLAVEVWQRAGCSRQDLQNSSVPPSRCKMESSVALSIGEVDRRPCLNEQLNHVGLAGDHSQVEGSLWKTSPWMKIIMLCYILMH
jgi:hypothetical protein